MAKRVDPLKAKAAKQKKIAIGLSLMFVLVLAYQGPKTLKMLKGPAAAPAAVADGTDPTALPAGVEAPTGTPAPTPTPSVGSPSSPAGAGAPSTPGSEPAVLANSDLPISAGAGQLLSFEQFASKDPFQQQVDDESAPGQPVGSAAGDGDDEPAPDEDSEGSEPVSPGVDPSIPGSAENPPLSTGGGLSGSGSGSGSSGSSGSETPSVPQNPDTGPAPATTISVNGIVHVVTVDTPFPVDQPTFELVSFARDGKSVQIGVAGGSLVGGGATVKLVLGKPLTLQNTADGSRYRLQLLTVEGAVPPASNG
jgi:hypothetical protein